MMKKVGAFLIKSVLIALMCLISADYIGNIMATIEKEVNISEAEECDAVFCGSSHVYMGVNPQYIYDETGITSVNLSASSQDMKGSYWMLKAYLENHHPQVAFIDSWPNGAEARQTYILWNYKDYNPKKLFAYLDLKNDEFGLSDSSRFLSFRTNYDMIDKQDFDYVKGEGGFKSDRWYNAIYSKEKKISQDEVDERSNTENEINATEVISYVDKIIELAEKKGVIPVFIKTPYIPTENEILFYEQLEKHLKEKNVDFYNFSDANSLLLYDLDKDFVDVGHLSYYGGLKFNQELVNVIIPKIDLHHNPSVPIDPSWESNRCHYQYTYDLLNERGDSLVNCLQRTLHLPKDYVSIISINGESYKRVNAQEKRILEDILGCQDIAENEYVIGVIEDGNIKIVRDWWKAELYDNIDKTTFHAIKEPGSGKATFGKESVSLSDGIDVKVYVKSYGYFLSNLSWYDEQDSK